MNFYSEKELKQIVENCKNLTELIKVQVYIIENKRSYTFHFFEEITGKINARSGKILTT